MTNGANSGIGYVRCSRKLDQLFCRVRKAPPASSLVPAPIESCDGRECPSYRCACKMLRLSVKEPCFIPSMSIASKVTWGSSAVVSKCIRANEHFSL